MSPPDGATNVSEPIDARYQDTLRAMTGNDDWPEVFAQFVIDYDWWCGARYVNRLKHKLGEVKRAAT
jgi:hypothetical protein